MPKENEFAVLCTYQCQAPPLIYGQYRGLGGDYTFSINECPMGGGSSCV